MIPVTYVTGKSIKYFQTRSYRDFTKKVVTTVTGYKVVTKLGAENEKFVFVGVVSELGVSPSIIGGSGAGF